MTNTQDTPQALRAAGRCPWCGEDITDPDTQFRGELSLREFHISGLCQNCQDGMFADGDPEV